VSGVKYLSEMDTIHTVAEHYFIYGRLNLTLFSHAVLNTRKYKNIYIEDGYSRCSFQREVLSGCSY